MKPTQPDRWERIVDKVLERDGRFSHYGVTDLLRKEHAWVVRMVRNYLSKWTDRTGPDIDAQEAYGRHCRALQCQEIIDQLKRRAK